jgi:mannose-6-phosphate isomerase
MNDSLYPLTFDPVYWRYPWGGRKLADVFDREIPGEPTAESWELSDRADGMSVIAHGPLEGTTLRSLIETRGEELLGTPTPETFPLLVKILDAKTALSVQVHPNDATAAAFGGEAKTEMWYVLDADPGARVYCGLKPGNTEGTLREAIEKDYLEKCLETIEVAKGDVIFVPGGCVHAIAAGCLLLEVQQNSNTTYRLYDWGRIGHDGKPRDLHIARAIQVIDWNPGNHGKIETREIKPGHTQLLRTPYFSLERIAIHQAHDLPTNGTWQILFVESGSIRIADKLDLAAGQTCLLPACMASCTLESRSGSTTQLIRIGP